jgi:hypothetical protein
MRLTRRPGEGQEGVESLLGGTRFSPLHHDWLRERERLLVERWAPRRGKARARVLLLNATLGLRFYPSIVDFFVTIQRACPEIRATSVSYFPEIRELAEAPGRRGLHVADVPWVLGCSADQLREFDLVIAIGPSEAFARLMTLADLRPKLVLLDLGFYHQMMASQPSFLTTRTASADGAGWSFGRSLQRNRAAAYTCQPVDKLRADLDGYFSIYRFEYKTLPYIPIGFGRNEYYRAEHKAFDVGLLGTGGRDHSLLVPYLLKGIRFLFVGAVERADGLARLKSLGDVTVVSGANEDDYAKLVALCRCVAMPLHRTTHNVLLSVVDALASGVPMVASPSAGFDELRRAGAPILFHHDRRHPTAPDCKLSINPLAAAMSLALDLRKLLSDESLRRDMGERALRFTEEHLDISRVMERILEEQVL